MTRKMARPFKAAVATALLLGGLGFLRCLPSTTPVCTASQTLCENTTCISTQSDPLNCGACAQPCPLGFNCVYGACACPASTTACTRDGGASACVSLLSDPQNCGACGHACASAQLCSYADGGPHCVSSCPSNTTACNGGCVDTTSDPLNCGACSTACGQGQACVSSVCRPDLIAACYDSHELVSIDTVDLSEQVNPLVVGDGPQSLAFYKPASGGDLLAVTDVPSSALYHLSADGIPQLQAGYDTVGNTPNQVIAVDMTDDKLPSPHLLWVINSLDNNVQAIDYTLPLPSDGGTSRTVEQVPTIPAGATNAANTNPYFMTAAVNPNAKRTMLYVTLYGNCAAGAAGMAAGNRVVEIDPAANNNTGAVTRTYAVASGSALQPPDGGTTYAQPNGIVATNGKLYVALSNATADCFSAHGPGLVEVVDLGSFAQRALIPLGPGCTNPGFVVASGSNVFVTCSGTYDQTTFLPLGNGGVAIINATTDTLSSFVPLTCSSGADAGCSQAAPGPIRVRNGNLYIADTGNGRVFVVGTDGTIKRGLANPVNVCASATGTAQYVSDLAVP